MLIFFQSFELPDFKVLLFNLSRIREKWRISESNQGLSSRRTVTSLLGLHVLTKLRKVSVNFSKASLIDPSYKRSQLWFTSCLN